ncbi:MAG TPA: hypothetical protein VHM21_05300 [Sphingomicrobium sp.]|jgi:tetratricopeptide (TPR) repeat protein|nr:hypothetical protein [Sphingomicrobium sp.]
MRAIFLGAMLMLPATMAQAQILGQNSRPEINNNQTQSSAWGMNYDQKRNSGFKADDYQLAPFELKALRELEKRIAAGDVAKAREAAVKAEAAATSPDGQFVLGALELQLADKALDEALRVKATDRVLASGKAPVAMLPVLYKNQGMYALGRNDLATADKAFTRLVDLNPLPETMIILAQVKTDRGAYAEAVPLFDKAIGAKKASGQPVPEVWVKVADQVRTKVAGR